MGSVNNVLNIIFLVFLIFAGGVALYQKKASKNKKTSGDANGSSEISKSIQKTKDNCESVGVTDFLNFEKISNDMIIRDMSTKFTMVVHCSGLNYDLMSENEKAMVEESFIDLLNFIQFPTQIYVQTRKVDLKDSLKLYEQKVKNIENEIRILIDRYNELKAQKNVSYDQLGILEYEIQRKENLYDYAQDLKNHIERMSMNKDVLQQKYYIVLTYHIEELGLMNNLTEPEVEQMARAELITRCSSIMGAIGGCGIEAEILDSNGLAELIYMAVNRDDAEQYRLKDSMEAGFYRLYSTTETAKALQQDKMEDIADDMDNQLQFINGQLDLSKISKLVNE